MNSAISDYEIKKAVDSGDSMVVLVDKGEGMNCILKNASKELQVSLLMTSVSHLLEEFPEEIKEQVIMNFLKDVLSE